MTDDMKRAAYYLAQGAGCTYGAWAASPSPLAWLFVAVGAFAVFMAGANYASDHYEGRR